MGSFFERAMFVALSVGVFLACVLREGGEE